MLSLNDVISKFKKAYSGAILTTGEKLSALTDNVDVLVDVLNDDDLTGTLKTTEISGIDAISVIQSIGGIFDGYTSSSSELDPNAVDLINFTREIDGSITRIKANGAVVLNLIPIGTDALRMSWHSLKNKQGDFISWEGWFNDLISKYSTSQVISKACELAQRGELSAVTLKSFFTDVVSQNKSEAKQVLDIICDTVNGSSVSSQITSLIAALRSIFSGAEGLSADDVKGEIQFSSTDFQVNTSICFDFATIINTASAVVSIIGSVINPIIGVISLGLSSAIKGIVESVSSNDGVNWKYLADGEYDFDGYATPIFQIEVPASQVPLDFKNRIDDANGFCKFQSGWLIMFGWVISNNRYRFEGFMCTRADLKRYEDGAGGLFNFVKNLVTASGGDCKYSNNIANNYGFKVNLQYWLNSNAMGGAQLPWDNDLDFYGDEVLYNVTANKFLMSVALMCYMYAVLNGSRLTGYVDTTVNYQDWVMADRAGRSDEQIITSFTWAYNEVIAPNVSNPYTFSSASQYIAGAVNNVVPCLRNRLNAMPEELLALLVSMDFHDNLDDSIDGMGLGSAWTTSYDLVAQGNPQIFPPTSTTSIWVKIAITALATAAIVAATAVVSVNIKRKIQYKAYTKRTSITNQLTKWADEGHQLTYDEFVGINKQARKYNRFWGKLAGNTLDINNNWLRYNTDSEVSNAGVSSRIANIGGMAVVPSVDTLVYKLISGEDPQ